MNDALQISIIVPVFNRKELLKETVNSVLAQSDPHWELILIDDGSSDGSDRYCDAIAQKHEKVRFHRNETGKKGAPSCRNYGARLASFGYLFFLDSDDLLSIHSIRDRRESILQHPDLDAWIFPMLYFRKQKDDMRILQNVPDNADPLDRFLSRENVWIHPLWKKDFFLNVLGGANESALSFQDWEVNVRALIAGGKTHFFASLPPDIYYRQHDETISSTRYGEQHAASNASMLLDVFSKLKSSEAFSEIRRSMLSGFFVDVINRYRYFPLPKQERITQQLRWLNAAVECGLIKENEKAKVASYLSRSRSVWAARFSFIRKSNEKKFRSGVLRHFFPVITKKQGKISYDGPLY